MPFAECAAAAYEAAILAGTQAAIVQLELELAKAQEEEEFTLMAMLLLSE